VSLRWRVEGGEEDEIEFTSFSVGWSGCVHHVVNELLLILFSPARTFGSDSLSRVERWLVVVSELQGRGNLGFMIRKKRESWVTKNFVIAVKTRPTMAANVRASRMERHRLRMTRGG